MHDENITKIQGNSIDRNSFQKVSDRLPFHIMSFFYLAIQLFEAISAKSSTLGCGRDWFTILITSASAVLSLFSFVVDFRVR